MSKFKVNSLVIDHIPPNVPANCLIRNRIRGGSGKPVKIHLGRLENRIQINHMEQLSDIAFVSLQL
jgi:hypothetical protein